MHVLVSGANGYIGRALSDRLAGLRELPGHGPIDRITLCDLTLDRPPEDERIRLIAGDFSDASTRAAALEPAVDVVFHLAGIASGRAEQEFDLGLNVNLESSLRLLEALRRQGNAPALVFSSSIAVFGESLPDLIDDDTALKPVLSYGAHKQVIEILLADYTRRGYVRGRALRLPGIVPRPSVSNGAWSLFTSTLIRSQIQEQACTLPVGPDASVWLMSLQCCVDNLLHAAALAAQPAGPRTTWTLPALRTSIGDIVAAFDAQTDGRATQRVSYRPDPYIEAQFGRMPPLHLPDACQAGFRADPDLNTLLNRARSSMRDEDGAKQTSTPNTQQHT
ncbi:MAG: NAD-dependent epimerase/dehydratase family protein [Burkholderiaceae bacterium]